MAIKKRFERLRKSWALFTEVYGAHKGETNGMNVQEVRPVPTGPFELTVSGQLESQVSTRFLKVKIKSLAEEARIIRLEETRSHGSLRDQLHNHRVVEVRREARATHLAYAMLRGRAYAQTERSRRFPDAGITCRVAAMVRKYGNLKTHPLGAQQLVDKWYQGACPMEVSGISTPQVTGSIPVTP